VRWANFGNVIREKGNGTPGAKKERTATLRRRKDQTSGRDDYRGGIRPRNMESESRRGPFETEDRCPSPNRREGEEEGSGS